MLPREKIDTLVARLANIDQRLAEPLDRETRIKLARERADIEPVQRAYQELLAAEKERADLDALLDDPEMGKIAGEEAKGLDQRIVDAQRTDPTAAPAEGCRRREKRDPRNPRRDRRQRGGAVRWRPLPHVPALRRLQRWKVEVLSESEGEAGGYKEIIAHVDGKGVFAQTEVRVGRASRSARAGDRGAGAHPYLGGDGRGAA